MNTLSSIIDTFDNFGINIKINFNSKDTFHNFFGFLLSIIIDLIIIIYSIILLCTDFSEKKCFISSSKIENTNYDINITKFPMIFAFECENGTILDEYSSILTIKPFLNIYDNNNDIIKSKEEIYYDNCNIDKHFFDYKNLFLDFNLTGYKCLNPKYHMKIMRNTSYNSKLIFSINKCVNNCSDDLETILNNGNIIFFFPDYEIYNYNKNNPIKLNLQKLKLTFYNNLNKRYLYKLNNNKYITDKGFIFNSNSKIEFLKISNYLNDINLSSNNLLGYISFEHGNYIIEYRRSYIKFQRYLSEIVSLSYILLIIFKFFSNIVSKKILSINIINSLIKKFPNNGNCTDISPLNISKEVVLDNSNNNFVNLASKIQGLKGEIKGGLNNSKNIIYNNSNKPNTFSKQLKYIIMKPRASNKGNINNIIASPSNKRYYNFVKGKEKMLKNDFYFLNTIKGSEFKSIKMNLIKEIFPRFGKTKSKLIDEMIETIGYYQSIENIIPIIIKDTKIMDDLISQKENSVILGKKKYININSNNNNNNNNNNSNNNINFNNLNNPKSK